MTWKRKLNLSVLGVITTFAGFASYVSIVAPLLKQLGLPPASWFGTDYTDLRGAFFSGACTLVVLGLLSFAIARFAYRLAWFKDRLGAFWISNPVSTGLGLFAARTLTRNWPPYEFTAALPYLLLVAWLIMWHCSTLGSRNASVKRCLVVVVGYAAVFLALGLFRVHLVYSID